MIYICTYLSVFMFFGHIVMGIKLYLKPMLKSDTEDIAKSVMHAVFHYVSVIMLLSSITLILFAHNIVEMSSDVVLFIGVFYLGCGILQMIMAIVSKGLQGLIKMFQWTMFIPIGILAILSVL